jgi:hypothetical protein
MESNQKIMRELEKHLIDAKELALTVIMNSGGDMREQNRAAALLIAINSATEKAFSTIRNIG